MLCGQSGGLPPQQHRGPPQPPEKSAPKGLMAFQIWEVGVSAGGGRAIATFSHPSSYEKQPSVHMCTKAAEVPRK